MENVNGALYHWIRTYGDDSIYGELLYIDGALVSDKEIDYTGVLYDVDVIDGVRYPRLGTSPQTLTEEQRENARNNIGAIPTPASAAVGQTIIVKAVDENGKPTEWEAADVGEEWEKLNEFSLTENALTVLMNADADGNAFKLKKMRVFMYLPECQNTSGEATSTGYANYYVNGVGRFTYPSSGWSNNYFTWSFEAIGNYILVKCYKGAYSGPGLINTTWHNVIYPNSTFGGFISSFEWSIFNPMADKPSAMAGATFEVWGVRA